MPLASDAILGAGDVVAVVERSVVVYHALQIVDQAILGVFLVRVQHEWRYVETVDREVYLVLHLLVEHHVVLLESVEAEDEDRCYAVELDLLQCALVLLAPTTVPAVLRAETLSHAELLQTTLDGLFCSLSRSVWATGMGKHPRMGPRVGQLVNFLNLLHELKVVCEEKHFKLDR